MCLEFWQAMRETSFVTKHPSLPRSSWHRIIPLGFHGDAGAFSHQDSLYAISWNSLVGSGSTAQKRFLFIVLRKSEMTHETMDAAFRAMAWSFNLMLEGKRPAKNMHGRSIPGGGGLLAEGWRAALCQLRGDWAFVHRGFQTPSMEWCRAHVLALQSQQHHS